MGGTGTGSPDFGKTGTGRSGGSAGGEGGSRSAPCEIYERTSLASPRPELVDKLSENVRLSLELSNNEPPVRALYNGEVAGVIILSVMADLVRCMREGHKYSARVVMVSGGYCEVDVMWEGS